MPNIMFSSEEVGCGVVEWVKRSTLRWFGHIEIKKVYLSTGVEGTNWRVWPLRRWKDRVKEYVSERGVRGDRWEWAGRESMDRESWRSICRGHSP